ncbi:MAG: hypothetical protein WBC04_07420 [Candidatus Acidiferrales bacterium]
MTHKIRGSSLALALGLFLVGPIVGAGFAQEKHASQMAGVDNTKMGPYRALAQLAYAAFQKGDHATAAQVAKVLERVWDKAEDYGGATALSKTNPAQFEAIDKAMDQFVGPLMAATPADPAKVKFAYAEYLGKLKLAD